MAARPTGRAASPSAAATGEIVESKVPDISLMTAMRDYVAKLIGVPGMKVLLLDADTVEYVALCYSQTEIIARDVVLVSRADSENETDERKQAMHHLKAIVFVRPTSKNIERIRAILQKPKYKEYHIFFSNILPENALKSLAEADDFDLIRQVQEYYLDVLACNDNMFHLGLTKNFRLLQDPNFWNKSENEMFQRQSAGLLSVMLGLRRKFAIRYAGQSQLATMLAQETHRRVKEDPGLFHFGGETRALLLIIDRKDDPVTPLLSQWTYQAMIHDLIGIRNNIVNMSHVPKVREEHKEVVINPLQDDFFAREMYDNWAGLNSKLQDYLRKFQQEHKTTEKLDSIADLTKFVENFPEFRALQANVSKHMNITPELGRQIELRRLYDVSPLEQELACKQDHSSALADVHRFLGDDGIEGKSKPVPFMEKLRLVMLYALRYENEPRNEIEQMKRILHDKAQVTDRRTDRENADATAENMARFNALEELLRQMGNAKRGTIDLFKTAGWRAPFAQLKNAFKDVENVFTQHRPPLLDILTSLKTTPKNPAYPFASTDTTPVSGWNLIVVYVIGGATYEESAALYEANKTKEWAGTRLLLGGSCVHSSTSFIDDLVGRETRKPAASGDVLSIRVAK